MSMRLLLIGAPGSGKGTQAAKIQEEFKIPQISTGDILRTAVRNGTPLGKEVAGYMNSGNLVPNELIIDLMNERLNADDCRNGYILDGFPRTVKQAEALDELLIQGGQKLDMVISVDVEDDEVVKRLGGRRQCTGCSEGYHIEFKKPAKDNCCDKCGSELYLREDDKEQTIRARLAVYREQTEPLLDYYSKKGLLRRVKGVGSIQDIYGAVSSLIKKINP